ncbi:MAG: hypothetical protein POH28_01360 [Acidocella sp.]|nr:hypothetical protein [Acidocella sp.]
MSEVITDRTGRRIMLRDVGVAVQMRLFKILGPALSVNPAYMHGAMVAAAVAMIDEVPVPFPQSEAAVEQVLEKIGMEMIEAIGVLISGPGDAHELAMAGN